MNNTKPITFTYNLPNDLSLEVNARVDTRTEQEVYDEVIGILNNIILVKTTEQPTGNTKDVHWHVGSINSAAYVETVKSWFTNQPVKVYYLSNNENIYIEYDPQKSVEVLTIFRGKDEVKDIVLANPEWVSQISKKAILEANKPETING